MKLMLKSPHLNFNGEIYKQIDDVAMCVLLRPLLVNIVLWQNLEISLYHAKETKLYMETIGQRHNFFCKSGLKGSYNKFNNTEIAQDSMIPFLDFLVMNYTLKNIF